MYFHFQFIIGSFATATCMACKRKVEADDVREDIFNQVHRIVLFMCMPNIHFYTKNIVIKL
jgi:NAD-dependent SIR2 family protein deacetylase